LYEFSGFSFPNFIYDLKTKTSKIIQNVYIAYNYPDRTTIFNY
jgi:hypothetical protein